MAKAATVAKLNSIKPGLITTKLPINPTITAVHLFIPTFSPNKIGDNAVVTRGATKASVKALAIDITDINKQNAAKAAKEKERTDWLSKTKNSPAAKAGLSDDLRWKAREKHVKFQKDNNRGEFKAKTKEVPSKFAANKDKDTFKRRDAKLVAKGLKPPTYTKNVKVQEDIGPRLVKRALKNLPSELAPAALMSGVLDKAKGFANKNTFIKGAIDGATGTTKILGKMVTPPKGRKLTPNVKSTERIAQGGALAVRKPSPSQKIKDTAGDVAKKVGETVKGTAEKLKKVKLKNPIPKAVGKAVGNYGVPIGIGVGIHKTLNREDYEPFELVLDYLVETQQEIGRASCRERV